jgi:antitoxin ParD1/3/4
MNISISLPPELISLIKSKVESGRYSSTSEVVREALRLLERADQQEAERLKGLRRAWREGLDSGDAGELDFRRTASYREARADGSQTESLKGPHGPLHRRRPPRSHRPLA